MTSTKRGFFLIADISGYTEYLSQSELEHAQEILQTLLELLIDHTRPPLIISRLAGDAVISYGLEDNFFRGQTFVEMIEDTYVSFREALNLIALNNTCQCQACANVSSLDLKFFVHYGSFAIQKLKAHDELVGSDVNLIHRLLKNRVIEETGIQAYTLYTDAAIHQLQIEDISKTMRPHLETYEHLGQIKTWIQDMHPVWQRKKDQVRIEIKAEDCLVQIEEDFPLPPPVMWDLITDPEYRAIFVQSTRQDILNRKNGRLAPGSIYQCFHGNGRVTTQTILEWLPFEQITTEDTVPLPFKVTVLLNTKLKAMNGGTRLTFTCSKARGSLLGRTTTNLIGRFIVRKNFQDGMHAFQERISREIGEGKHHLMQTTVDLEVIKG